jgi:hypothetical protein
VNNGILHRDISDGNVLMLRNGQKPLCREWKEPRVPRFGLEDDKLAKSEEL